MTYADLYKSILENGLGKDVSASNVLNEVVFSFHTNRSQITGRISIRNRSVSYTEHFYDREETFDGSGKFTTVQELIEILRL